MPVNTGVIELIKYKLALRMCVSVCIHSVKEDVDHKHLCVCVLDVPNIYACTCVCAPGSSPPLLPDRQFQNLCYCAYIW